MPARLVSTFLIACVTALPVLAQPAGDRPVTLSELVGILTELNSGGGLSFDPPAFERPPVHGGMQIFDPSLAGQTQGCQPPRPDDIGCSVLCKPCITFVCVEASWTAERIDFPDEICNPPGGGGGPGPDMTACPRSDTGFCPAECSMCF